MLFESCKDDSNIFAMRIYNYIAPLSVLTPYVIANLTNTITAAIGGKPISFIDIPVVAGGIVVGIVTMKTVQSAIENKK